jgi:3-hydroxyacyl-CoA dehydrogenase/enoyl-CoA hydratase/3-hydroxybutyryl-CoA epimerase
MAKAVPYPGRFLGLHFFNPAHLMQLVEVIVHDETDPAVVASAMRFMQAVGKVPILVKDSPGFVVNRILMPYMLEAVRLAEMMRDPWEIDEAMVAFGMPMGPLRLLDEVGFDIALHVERTMRAAFDGRLPKSGLLEKMVSLGMLGRKNGRGFYADHNKKKGHPQPNREILALIFSKEAPLFKNHEAMANHLHSFMRTEAALCLSEGVAASAQDIELAMILGAGHPPFRKLFSDLSPNLTGTRHEKHT